ncbi:hypothetical protein CBR_g19250 [Chara braunii]|uniref:Uncharacterized protein n=1 Tax=Chara braunii TaxID=69332 RepID=A0A388JTN5_CHABU|nr:hypothetical protein CBR_g19250 [Chara braunii]|eukprot:GBG61174.1 hypothetical protein CBR_g19250 [Chara braunii]
MSFLTERGLGDHMLAPRDDISAIRQVHHPRFSLNLLRLAQFFNTTRVYAATEFRFTGHRQAIVLAEATTVRRLSTPGVSHVSTVIIFSGDISAINPLRHTAIQSTLRQWGQQLAAEWNQWLTRHSDNLIPTDGIEVRGLRTSRHEPAVVLPELWERWCEHFVDLSMCLVGAQLTWTRDIEHRAWVAYVELLIIQAWRTEVEGDLLGILFGSVRPGHRQQIVQELMIPLAQLADDLPLDIVSQCDESPVSHILSRTLTPYLQWSACLEELAGNNNPPSQQQYLDPRGIIDLAFFQPRTASKDEAITLEEEDEEGSDEEDGEETPEEGSYNEHNEGEQSEEEEEEEEEEEDQLEEEEESEWETLGEEADRAEPYKEDPEAARRREEIAAGKQPLEFVSEVDLSIPNDPTKDPEPPKGDYGDLGAGTSSAPARRRRSRCPSPSTSARPLVRARTNAGHRASSPFVLSPSP